MYIQPNTTIRILKNCPLDSTYDHTIFFVTATQQANYMSSLTKYTLERQSYQRTQRGYMRVNIRAENLYDCNYIMYRNDAFGTKWFYAFITSVEYVNNEVSEIQFELDEMQTWLFDYQLEQCFVEREHSVTDNPGDNLVDENIAYGEYIYDPVPVRTGAFSNMYIVIATSYDTTVPGFPPASGNCYNGIYSGLHYTWFAYNTQGIQQLNDTLNYITDSNRSDGIVSVFPCPYEFLNAGHLIGDNYHVETPAISRPTGISEFFDNNVSETYVPRNKKLLTFPYTFLYATTFMNEGKAFPYEYFLNPNNITFRLIGECSCSPKFMLYPLNYKNLGVNLDDTIELGDFPQFAYATDTFRAWLAQQTVGAAGSMLTQLPMALAGAATGNPWLVYGAGRQLLNEVSGAVSSGLKAATAPPKHHSGRAGNSIYLANDELDIYVYKKHIRIEYARIIDDYFDRYGYACKRNKIPNRAARNSWTYTKTIGCTITGSIPSDAEKKICSIYDRGITFWKFGATVGDYTQDNSPIGTTS